MSQRRILLAAFCLCGILKLAVADDVLPEVDLSTPKQAMISLTKLSEAGRVDQFHRVFVEPANDEERTRLEYGMSDDVYMPVLFNALKAKFPDATEVPDVAKNLGNVRKHIEEKCTETITGDTATVVPTASPNAMAVKFRKVGQEWKLTLDAGFFVRGLEGEKLDLAKAQRAAYLETAKEVEAGKYASAKEAMQACEQRRREAFAKFQQTEKPAAP